MIFLTNIDLQETEEKCVLVSHYTSTLNILESYCKKMNYSYFHLDGCVPMFCTLTFVLEPCIRQTPAAKRQEYVNTFNKTNQKTSCKFIQIVPDVGALHVIKVIFLLSSKAGGVGINLIGTIPYRRG